MKAIYSISIMVAAVALLAFSVPVHAATMDSRIELSANSGTPHEDCTECSTSKESQHHKESGHGNNYKEV